jgi:hypothetical protein
MNTTEDINPTDEFEFPLEGSTWTYRSTRTKQFARHYGKGPFVAFLKGPRTIKADTDRPVEIRSVTLLYWEKEDGTAYFPPEGTNQWPPQKKAKARLSISAVTTNSDGTPYRLKFLRDWEHCPLTANASK